ncbi:hypothetical protein EOD41_04360 [Mucilaginibacter limnophilus]|uniref:Cadherin-like beta sandwich domain-containing protein n=1 Tax=Mucilaginibacter limnophilus TaxID=1932778 RepID=A0A437MU64_9SPHI|nr:hypothetical protein [Mucilaginibacter limnophilus]RVU01205.1 hypothetical protein EOD41_04360 [Mucilaginibacter limnophilus]
MYKIKSKLIINSLLIATLSCLVSGCKKDHPNEQQTEQTKSSQKDILTFEFFKADNSNLIADYNTLQTDNTITATLPSGTNLNALKAAFTVSKKAVVMVSGQLQTSQVSVNDFTKPVIYTVKAEDGSTKSYTVTITTK